MTTLLDIAELKEHVLVRGQKIDVVGISAEGIAVLLFEFPELRAMMTGTADMQKDAAGTLMQKFPKAIGHIIAAGTGYPGDQKAIAFASKLGVSEQLAILSAIWKLTFAEG